MYLSIIIPAYNEEKNVNELYTRLVSALNKLKKTFEIIFIDDGSTDSTYKELKIIHSKDKRVKVIKFRKNFGQAAAWSAGIQYAKGNYIVTMDADLQNDPADIEKLIAKISEGYDVVSGWRYKRKDNLAKKFFSGISRFLRKIVIDDKIHDSGCSLKIYTRESLSEIELFGEMHRYITEMLALKGYKIAEIKVNHLPRKSGKTKYNLIRVPKGFLDLIVVAFWQKYSARPVHLFGGTGIITTLLGIIIGIYLLFQKFYENQAIADRPLLLLAILLVMLGIQFLIFGLIADILIKLYYHGYKKPYNVETFLG